MQVDGLLLLYAFLSVCLFVCLEHMYKVTRLQNCVYYGKDLSFNIHDWLIAILSNNTKYTQLPYQNLCSKMPMPYKNAPPILHP